MSQNCDGVVVVERDPALTAQLRTRFGHVAALETVQADAAAHNWPHEPFVGVANLPFSRSGAILARLVRDPYSPAVSSPQRVLRG